ncbi:MAG: hypothetical protein LBJ15_14840 [Comamonas sp.]|uniref:hypothetical protein n=1 Tax=Comamonas sp. TaxID=34028 RepID=UPI002836CFE5|nr:hypothetical protein [Comamonas sp.]MDR0215267.1 hypothetical protein [Comamonas sp.]MDR2297366.1 hypothetical protein [Comamonas sp.]
MSHRNSLASGLAALALLCAATTAQAQAYISGSISGQLAPGVYGQVNIGNAAPPALLYGQPMWGGPVVQQAQPIYMWVPPGHARDWRRYCGRYHACGRPTYFLRDAPPQWRGGPPPRHERHWDHDDHRRWDRGERWDRHEHRGWERHDRENDQGHGRGRGHGHRDD